MSRPDITVVVCTYNRAEMLRDALNSLICQDTGAQFSYEVVVVDDASTDGTPKVVREAAERSPTPIRYVRATGKGIACARNKGIKETSTDWIAFFDDDQVAELDWLKELFVCAIQTGAQVIGGPVLPYLSDEEAHKASPLCRAMLHRTDGGRMPHKCGRKTFPGCGNMLVKTAVFQTVGQFDELLSRGGQDIEFGVRFRRAGLQAWLTPNAVAHHPVPAYRLQKGYSIWHSLRVGDTLAYTDFREWGLAGTLIACVARIVQASFINFPLMLLAYVSENRAEVIGRQCLLLRAWAYLRESLYLVSPRLFSQETYFSHLTMRERAK